MAFAKDHNQRTGTVSEMMYVKETNAKSNRFSVPRQPDPDASKKPKWWNDGFTSKPPPDDYLFLQQWCVGAHAAPQSRPSPVLLSLAAANQRGST